MSRISGVLDDLLHKKKKALVTFITAGDPAVECTVPALNALVKGGADLLELGIPFSDPEAEGPSIQASSERGLAQGVTLAKVLGLIGEFRKTNSSTPIILMGYLNSVLAMGIQNFANRASELGVDGVIMVNLPPEESEDLSLALSAREIDLIFLIAPTTTRERALRIAEKASGFIYYVSLKGITGADHLDISSIASDISWLRDSVDFPVLVGFGIKSAETAAEVASYSDGVVIGSMLVELMNRYSNSVDEMCEQLFVETQKLRDAIDAN